MSILVDELISTIQRSDLPTVVVEGHNDVRVYRKLESWLGATKANFVECGGRKPLIEIFRRRAELQEKRVCFVADKDMWIFTSIPDDLRDIVFSEGYSIENDLYSDFDVEKLLSDDERKNHQTMIREIARWFAREVEKFFNGDDYVVRPNLHLLIPIPNFTCCLKELARLGFVEANPAIIEDIASNYKMKLQGKLLYEVLLRFCSAPKRRPKYSGEGLIELALTYSSNGVLISRILHAIREKLGMAFELQP